MKGHVHISDSGKVAVVTGRAGNREAIRLRLAKDGSQREAHPAERQEAIDGVALKRLETPEDVAKVVSSLRKPAGRPGTAVVVNGYE
jgi:formylmethanofuran dehydrogenase subunit E